MIYINFSVIQNHGPWYCDCPWCYWKGEFLSLSWLQAATLLVAMVYKKKSGFNLAKKLYFSWISFHYYIWSFAKLCLFLLICPNIKSLLDVLKKISSFSLVTEMLFQERILLFHVPKWPFKNSTVGCLVVIFFT